MYALGERIKSNASNLKARFAGMDWVKVKQSALEGFARAAGGWLGGRVLAGVGSAFHRLYTSFQP